jgi:hypothetical protein
MQIGLYNSMLEKEGTEGEEEAKKAYMAAREESGHADEDAAEEKVSSALIEKVRNPFTHVIPYLISLWLKLVRYVFNLSLLLKFFFCLTYID